MEIQRLLWCSVAIFCALPFEVLAQDAFAAKNGRAPIYTVTVVERTTKAINYEYRSIPTMIDFRGTVLLPKAKGEAIVESKRGRTEVDAKIESLPAPTRFGREYLTYVLWAITPEGAPHNLGEVVASGTDKARLHVTTDLQAFGLIVTAEPYAAIHQPSDVVVLENEVRPDTIGKIEEIQARYELMPRGHYTLNIDKGIGTETSGGPKISMDRYEAQLELYEAQNAIAIAVTADAERYAPEVMLKARQIFNQAQRNWTGKVSPKLVVQDAREAAQTAEDARVVAERRRQQEQAASAAAEIARAQQAKAEARADADRAIAEASAARAQADAERAARERAEADTAEARREVAVQVEALSRPAAAPPPPAQPVLRPDTQRSELRAALLDQLNSVLPTRDTPAGLVVTVADSSFAGSELHGVARTRVGRIAEVLATYSDLRIEVDGHSDSAANESMSVKRAGAVRRTLEDRGVPSSRVSLRSWGDSRPLTSNRTTAGREENRRVDMVILGTPIGTLPSWDRTSSLTQDH